MTTETFAALLERCYRGQGCAESLQLTLHAFDAAVEDSDRERCSIMHLKSERRLRVFAGNFNLIAPYQDGLAVTLPKNHPVVARLAELDGYEEDAPKRHPGLRPVVIPRRALPGIESSLLEGLRTAARELTATGRPNRQHDDALETALRRAVTGRE